jgi:hypothetical protein
MPAPLVSPTDEREELGPRSLGPAALFGARLPSLFEARRRLPTSATTIDVRATKPELSHPRREGGLDLHPFLTRHAESLARLGDTRRAARRPFAMAPVLVPPACAGLPNRDATSSAPPPGIAPAVHSEDRRARVEGPSEGRVPMRVRYCARDGCRRIDARRRTTFPSSAASGHPLSPARARAMEETITR